MEGALALGRLMEALSDGLNSLQGGSAIILGVILGLMMAFDMGGPLNKTAYAFATAGLGAAAARHPDGQGRPGTGQDHPRRCAGKTDAAMALRVAAGRGTMAG